MCFEERIKWLIFESSQPISNSSALNLLKESNIFVNADVAYLNLNEIMNLYPRLATFLFHQLQETYC